MAAGEGFVVWFTGLSGSGKSTLAAMLAAELARRGVHVLEGFMTPRDYLRVVRERRLESGAVWSIPITLPAPAETAARLPAGRVVLAVYPAAMRYAGPREAIFHALVRKNYGSSHFIVGRDHAGVGRFYGPYDAQRAFDDFLPGELGIEPLAFEEAFWSTTVGGMATAKTAPGDASTRITLSGTQVREMLGAGRLPPAELTRPEVARILLDAALEQRDRAA
jgi:ATP sulfurylase